MGESSFFGDLLSSIADRGRRLLRSSSPSKAPQAPGATLAADCEALLETRGEASRVALAGRVIERWSAGDDAERAEFFRMLRSDFGPDRDRLDAAVDAWRAEPSQETAQALNAASEPRRQELVRRLALAPDGMAALMRMRDRLLGMLAEEPALKVVDDDVSHLFGSWFNRGFLVLRPIDWSTPANVLEKIIRYEAVHAIGDWDELRRRVDPEDRRCFAFFHPRLIDEPLIFVEVALTKSMPASVAEVLDADREVISAGDAGAAVFYSISNCQRGLKGVSFGNFLIKQVVEDLRHDLPEIATFVTLSPVPGFAAWLSRELSSETSDAILPEERPLLDGLDDRGWMDDPETVDRLRPVLSRLCAHYLVHARGGRGGVIDPVARFHLGNGARLERVNFLADRSARAARQAHGMMVNYLYDLAEIEKNHEAFLDKGAVAASASVKRLARPPKPADAKASEAEAAR